MHLQLLALRAGASPACPNSMAPLRPFCPGCPRATGKRKAGSITWWLAQFELEPTRWSVRPSLGLNLLQVIMTRWCVHHSLSLVEDGNTDCAVGECMKNGDDSMERSSQSLSLIHRT